MTLPKQDRWYDYSFVITILWIGFLLAIGLLETPLRFRAESITLPIALQIGRLVFHGLNYCEIGFALLILLFHCCARPDRKTGYFFALAVVILIVQTLLLFLVLDQRTDAIIAGNEVAESSAHSIYIGLELVKFVVLIFLAVCQILNFKKRVAQYASIK